MAKAVEQVSRGVVWPYLDLLPGTGNTPPSLTETVRVDAGVIVPPQDLAVGEARKAVETFYDLDVPVAKVIENMSHAVCECGRRSRPFGRRGGDRLARETGCLLLAQVPLAAAGNRAGGGGRRTAGRSPQ